MVSPAALPGPPAALQAHAHRPPGPWSWSAPTQLAHAMRGRRKLSVRPHLERVADVDDERAGARRRVDPFARAVHHFEPGRRRQKNGEAFVVRVRADADGHLGRGVRRVVQQTQLARRRGHEAIEKCFRQVERKRETSQQRATQLEHRVVVAAHGSFEAWQLRPHVGPRKRLLTRRGGAGGRLEAQVERLFLIARAAVKHFFARRHVAAMIVRFADVIRQLFVGTQREEAPRLLEQGLRHRLADTVPRQVAEPGFATSSPERTRRPLSDFELIRVQARNVDLGQLLKGIVRGSRHRSTRSSPHSSVENVSDAARVTKSRWASASAPSTPRDT